MIKKIIYLSLSLAFSSYLPDDFILKTTIGYNNNFLNFSKYEMDQSSNDVSILGDSETFDSHIIGNSLNYSKNLKIIPILLDLNFSSINYIQSKDKSSFKYSINLSYKIKSYNWFKVGYKNSPKVYLKMYKDLDQNNIPLLPTDFSSEKIFLSYSYPIHKGIWFKLQLSNSSIYFNSFFTEYDLVINDLYLKCFNLLNGKINISYKFLVADNVSFNSGLKSNLNDRSYLEKIFGFNFNLSKSYKITIFSKLREYDSENESDIVHFGRWHHHIDIIQRINKNINDNLKFSIYSKYFQRNTKSPYDYTIDLKSFKGFEIGLDIILNLTDKIYEVSY